MLKFDVSFPEASAWHVWLMSLQEDEDEEEEEEEEEEEIEEPKPKVAPGK